MRPYIAIIKDSFRAAMASRVLYVLLLLIAILLLLLAPLHMRETLEWKLVDRDNVKQPHLVGRRLVERRDKPNDKPIARIWSQLPKKLRDRLVSIHDPSDDEQGELESEAEGSELEDSEQSGSESDSTEQQENTNDTEATEDGDSDQDAEESEARPTRSRGRGPPGHVDRLLAHQQLIEELNAQIQDPDFYRAEDWDDISLSEETRELIDAGVKNLSEERNRRLNRLLVARALSPTIDPGNTALDFWYGFWKADFLTVNYSHQQFAKELTSQLPYYFDKFVLSIGLFIAILVTANMIPETFEPGSLNLLLSKPISRWGLYLAKFLGGCVFILLCASLLFVGVWIWLGLAMEIWDRAILYSIPLYVLVFAIYFSVSALVGLVWRSAIVAVILTLLFWALCFSVGVVHNFFAVRMSNNEWVNLVAAEDQVYAVDLLHRLHQWDEKKDEWTSVTEAGLNQEQEIQVAVNSWMMPLKAIPGIPGINERLAPVVDTEESRIFTSKYSFGQFLSTPDIPLLVGSAADSEFRSVGQFPRDTIKLFVDSEGLVAVTSNGKFFRMKEEQLAQQTEIAIAEEKREGEEKKDEKKEPEKKSGFGIFGGKKKSNEPNVLFEEISPKKRVRVQFPENVSFSSDRQQVAMYRRGKLTLFARTDDGRYEKSESTEIELEFDRKMSSLLEFKGSTIMLAFGNGRIITLDADSLKPRETYHPESRSAIDELIGSPDGRHFAARYRNGNLWVLDVDDPDQFELADVIGQGEVCAVGFGEDGQLWVAENTDRVTAWDPDMWKQGDRYVYGGTWLEKTFRWGLSPVYRLFPKPGEFYKIVTHLSDSGDTSDNLDIDLRANPLEQADPWSPLWTGTAFMAVMLLIACTIFHFKDF